jgi:hypothetical protein
MLEGPQRKSSQPVFPPSKGRSGKKRRQVLLSGFDIETKN